MSSGQMCQKLPSPKSSQRAAGIAQKEKKKPIASIMYMVCLEKLRIDLYQSTSILEGGSKEEKEPRGWRITPCL